jgi:bacterioferritin (cytochrome b1)
MQLSAVKVCDTLNRVNTFSLVALAHYLAHHRFGLLGH